MESTRQQKFARLIHKEVGELLQREGANYYGKAFVTVTIVRVSPDLSYVKVYVSVMGTTAREKVVDLLNENIRDVRRRLGMQIKHQIRHIPELHFYLDDSFDYVEKIDKLFKEIERPRKEDSED
jgi:ribosome-binding factor A